MRTASCFLLKLFVVLMIMMAFHFQPVSCEITCEPGVGKSGSAKKAFFSLQSWEQWSFTPDYPKVREIVETVSMKMLLLLATGLLLSFIHSFFL